MKPNQVVILRTLINSDVTTVKKEDLKREPPLHRPYSLLFLYNFLI
jgi:hypothetical protein